MTNTRQFAKVGDLTIHYDLADYTEPWRKDEPDAVVAEVRKFLQEHR